MDVIGDRYELLGELGRGGTGVVFRARVVPDPLVLEALRELARNLPVEGPEVALARLGHLTDAQRGQVLRVFGDVGAYIDEHRG